MSKFKVHLKVTGFELDLEGSRDDVPLIAQNIGQQIAGLIEPASHIIEGDMPPGNGSGREVAQQITLQPTKTRKNTKRVSSIKVGDTGSDDQVISWKHDPGKWGSPQQVWTAVKKAIWLLYVVEKETGTKELTCGTIAATFNHHFQQAKRVLKANVNRDLGKVKIKPNTAVSENTSENPSKWFLTQEGYKVAEGLVTEARGN